MNLMRGDCAYSLKHNKLGFYMNYNFLVRSNNVKKPNFAQCIKDTNQHIVLFTQFWNIVDKDNL